MRHPIASLSVVLPCFNEEAQIEQTIRNVHLWLKHKRIRGEIVAINNGSTDSTGQLLKRLSDRYSELRIVTHRIHQGYGGSVRSGCDAARMDIIAYMDSDGQYNVNDFNRLIPFLRSVDFAAGIRVRRSDPMIRKIYAALWNAVIRTLFDIRAVDIDCSMKIFRRSIWPFIRPKYGTGNLFSAELFLRLKQNEISLRQRAVRHFPRLQGKATCIHFFGILHTLYQLWILLIHMRNIRHGAGRGSNIKNTLSPCVSSSALS